MTFKIFLQLLNLQTPISEYKIRVRERVPQQNQFGAGVNYSSDRAQQRDNKNNIKNNKNIYSRG